VKPLVYTSKIEFTADVLRGDEVEELREEFSVAGEPDVGHAAVHGHTHLLVYLLLPSLPFISTTHTQARQLPATTHNRLAQVVIN